MKKVLIVCTVGCFLNFELNDIKLLNKHGYKVYIACNFNGYEEIFNKLIALNTTNIQIDFSRQPFSKNNIQAYKELKNLMDKERFDLLHCHTPVGGVIARLVGKKYRKNGMKIIYTAHGFHFYKGSSFKNWILYYPIEKFFSRYTDMLITINREDYRRAQNKLSAKKVEYIPSVGIDTKKYLNETTDLVHKETRESFGIPQDSIWIISVGELNRNKNHEIIIRALKKLEIENKNIFYTIAGDGELKEYLEEMIRKLGLENKIKLLGHQDDVKKLLDAADIFCFPSIREGLGLAAVEAMACGLPLITSNVQGINDYNTNGKNGFKCKSNDLDEFVSAINSLVQNEKLRIEFGNNNKIEVKKFDISIVEEKMEKIYSSFE